jgi:RNA polymerase sigma-70 factor (ECF subfamily)
MAGGGDEVSIDVAAPVVSPARSDFAVLYEAHFPRLGGYCLALVGDPNAAVDIAQEAFVRLFGRWTSVRNPQAWVYFVATNLATDHWRARSRERGAVDALGLSEQRRGPAPAHDPWLRDLVERLPASLRTPVLLHYYADMPVQEVARLLRRPEGTIKRRLHEARAALSSQMGADSA